MSKEEKKEWDQRINERIELEGRCQLFHNDLVLSAGTYYMKIFPVYELDKDNFLSQASYNCSLITDVAFYESENITVHYSQSEDAYSQPFKKHEPHSVYERYLKSKQNFPKEFNMNIFQSVLTEDDKNCLEFEIKFYAMKKKVLQTLHEHFPLIPSLLPQGIRDIDLLADHVTYMLIMDLHTSKNRVKGECKDYFEKLDKDVEEKLRKEEYL